MQVYNYFLIKTETCVVFLLSCLFLHVLQEGVPLPAAHGCLCARDWLLSHFQGSWLIFLALLLSFCLEAGEISFSTQ